MTTIYALLDDDQIRYIGKTTKTDLDEKLRQHMLDAFSFPEKFKWINNLWIKGSSPKIKSIFTYNDNESEFYDKMFLDHYKFFSGLKINNINNLISKDRFTKMNPYSYSINSNGTSTIL